MRCAVLGFVPLGSEKLSSHAKQNLGTSWPWFFSTFPQAPPSFFSINLLAFYHKCRPLIGYATHYLSCDR